MIAKLPYSFDEVESNLYNDFLCVFLMNIKQDFLFIKRASFVGGSRENETKEKLQSRNEITQHYFQLES